eukprot:gene10093-18743_t
MIIDCTDIEVAAPGSMSGQKLICSTYRGMNSLGLHQMLSLLIRVDITLESTSTGITRQRRLEIGAVPSIDAAGSPPESLPSKRQQRHLKRKGCLCTFTDISIGSDEDMPISVIAHEEYPPNDNKPYQKCGILSKKLLYYQKDNSRLKKELQELKNTQNPTSLSQLDETETVVDSDFSELTAATEMRLKMTCWMSGRTK